jgi:transcriptional antiterminator RfaH
MTDMEDRVGYSTDDQADANPRHRPCVKDLDGRWWVLHTRPRNEKAIAAVLDRRGVDYFLPLVRHQRQLRGRILHVDLPLFPSYLFLCGDWKARETALKTNRVAKVLEVPDQGQLTADLQQIERVLSSGEPVDLYPALRAGARCRVRSGVLAGLEGVVLRRKGPWRVFVAVRFIAQSAELELDSALLEVID